MDTLSNNRRKVIPTANEEDSSANKQQEHAKKTTVVLQKPNETTKTREQILAERELKKQAKLKNKKQKTETTQKQLDTNLYNLHIDNENNEQKTKATDTHVSVNTVTVAVPESNAIEKTTLNTTTKAERRAIQEAQRAAKLAVTSKVIEKKTTIENKRTTTKELPFVHLVEEKGNTNECGESTRGTIIKTKPIQLKQDDNLRIGHRVKLFKHLYPKEIQIDKLINSIELHPAVIRLGIQYKERIIIGSNARCIAFLNALRLVVEDYQTPLQKDFARGLESDIQRYQKYLQMCRPISVSMVNALKYIKLHIKQLPSNESDENLREKLLDSIDTYLRDQIDKAAEAIRNSVQEKISAGDVLLTFGCSSLIENILVEAKKRAVDFSVIVVDSLPLHEGHEMLRRLINYGIRCTCVLINAVGFIMPGVTKVLLGAHALLANGYVMSRCGTAQVALIAKSYNVPVLVCCETHKFSERVQTDAFVYNEICDPNDLIHQTNDNLLDPLTNWTSIEHLTPLHLRYDITPPELVTAVVTEVAILPCTSVPVILRIKPSEIGY